MAVGYISRGSATVNGRDYRSGETFEASPDAVAFVLASGVVERWPPEEFVEGPSVEGPSVEGTSPEASDLVAVGSSPGQEKPSTRKRPAKSKD